MGDRLATIDMSRKVGRGWVPTGSPCNTNYTFSFHLTDTNKLVQFRQTHGLLYEAWISCCNLPVGLGPNLKGPVLRRYYEANVVSQVVATLPTLTLMTHESWVISVSVGKVRLRVS